VRICVAVTLLRGVTHIVLPFYESGTPKVLTTLTGVSWVGGTTVVFAGTAPADLVAGTMLGLVHTVSANTSYYACVATYGAVGDGTTDDSAAFQLALNTSNYIICERNKTYKLTNTVNATHTMTLDLNGSTLQLQYSSYKHGINVVQSSTGAQTFTIMNGNIQCYTSQNALSAIYSSTLQGTIVVVAVNFTVDAEVSTGGYAINLATPTAGSRLFIDRCYLRGSLGGVGVTAVNNTQGVDITVTRSYFYQGTYTSSYGIYSTRGIRSLIIDDCNMFSDAAGITTEALHLPVEGTCRVTNTIFNWPATNSYCVSVYGLETSATNPYYDTSRFYFANCQMKQAIQFTGTVAVSGTLGQFWMDNCEAWGVSIVSAGGAAFAQNLQLECSNCVIHNNLVSFYTIYIGANNLFHSNSFMMYNNCKFDNLHVFVNNVAPSYYTFTGKAYFGGCLINDYSTYGCVKLYGALDGQWTFDSCNIAAGASGSCPGAFVIDPMSAVDSQAIQSTMRMNIKNNRIYDDTRVVVYYNTCHNKSPYKLFITGNDGGGKLFHLNSVTGAPPPPGTVDQAAVDVIATLNRTHTAGANMTWDGAFVQMISALNNINQVPASGVITTW
jgi:hypothetical protein